MHRVKSNIHHTPLLVCTFGYLQFSFWEEKLIAPLIATPNVDNANRRQKKG
jgi:hypothetical protein